MKLLKLKLECLRVSRLGPLLWIIYIQDIIEDLESECLLFADDTCLFASGEDPAITSDVLNRDLKKEVYGPTSGKFYSMLVKVKI